MSDNALVTTENPPDDKPKSPEEVRAERMNSLVTTAFEKASTLKIKAEERDILLKRFDDSDVEILPTGECYIPHMLIRQRLIAAFGPGQWSMISTRESMADERVYCHWIMLVRGVRIGETWGSHFYLQNNPRSDLSDAYESTEGIAVRRIAAKMLGCGSQVWEPQYDREWIDKYAVQVWCKGKDGKTMPPQWRRVDAKPFWNESGVVAGQAKPAPAKQAHATEPAKAAERHPAETPATAGVEAGAAPPTITRDHAATLCKLLKVQGIVDSQGEADVSEVISLFKLRDGLLRYMTIKQFDDACERIKAKDASILPGHSAVKEATGAPPHQPKTGDVITEQQRDALAKFLPDMELIKPLLARYGVPVLSKILAQDYNDALQYAALLKAAGPDDGQWHDTIAAHVGAHRISMIPTDKLGQAMDFCNQPGGQK